MDSTKSGSIQSSSSGVDYYVSQAKAISSSLNPPPQPPPSSYHHLHHHPSPSSFISLSPHINTFPSTPPDPNSLNLDMTWATSLPPSSLLVHSCTILDGLTTTTSSSSSSKAMAAAALGRGPPSGSSSLHPSVQLPTQPAQPTATAPARGSKKRSRASRRAPTTVVATDTSNFRAMVQEFTGFPAAPFVSSPFCRPRLDLFHAAATAPAYPFGPLAQKLQAPLFAPISSSSSSMDHVAACFSRNSVANAINTSAASARSNTSSSSTASFGNYQLHSTVLQHPNLLNMQSPDFTFQSSLQPRTPPCHNSSTTPTFEANPPLGPSNLAAEGLGSFIAMEGLKPSRRPDGFSGWADGSA